MRPARWILLLLGLGVASTAGVDPGSAFHLWGGLLAGSALVALGFSITGHATWQGSTEALLGAWIVFSAIDPPMGAGDPVCWGYLAAGLGAAALVVAIPRAAVGNGPRLTRRRKM